MTKELDLTGLCNILGILPGEYAVALMNALAKVGHETQLTHPHHLAHFLAQMGIVSDDFRMGPDVSDLTPMVGRVDLIEFGAWCSTFDFNQSVDFLSAPALLKADPWYGLVPIYFWEKRNVGYWAARNNAKRVVKDVHDGDLTTYADHVERYARYSLVMLGYSPVGLKHFQSVAGLEVDGVVGKETLGALHAALKAAPEYTFVEFINKQPKQVKDFPELTKPKELKPVLEEKIKPVGRSFFGQLLTKLFRL